MDVLKEGWKIETAIKLYPVWQEYADSKTKVRVNCRRLCELHGRTSSRVELGESLWLDPIDVANFQ